MLLIAIILFIPWKRSTFEKIKKSISRFNNKNKPGELITPPTNVGAKTENISSDQVNTILRPQPQSGKVVLDRITDIELPDQPTPKSQQTYFCTHCGRELIGGVDFCPYCGTKALVNNKFCPTCGAVVYESAVFCTKCRTKIA